METVTGTALQFSRIISKMKKKPPFSSVLFVRKTGNENDSPTIFGFILDYFRKQGHC